MKSCYNVVRAALGKFARSNEILPNTHAALVSMGKIPPNDTPTETPFPIMHSTLVALGMDATEASNAIVDVTGVYQTGACPTCKTWRGASIKVEPSLGGMLSMSLEFFPSNSVRFGFTFIEREDGAVTMRIGLANNHFTPGDQPSALFVAQVLECVNGMLDDMAFLRLWIEYTVVFAAVYKSLGWEAPLPPQLQEYIRDAQDCIARRFAHA